MRRRVTPLFLIFGSFFCALPQAGRGQEPPATQDRQPKKSDATAASLTGCVDEQDGKYVLIHDRTRDLIATLEAEGFPVEAFAKHLGHKVTVRGTSNPNGAHPVIKVRSVETISETCGTAQH